MIIFIIIILMMIVIITAIIKMSKTHSVFTIKNASEN